MPLQIRLMDADNRSLLRSLRDLGFPIFPRFQGEHSKSVQLLTVRRDVREFIEMFEGYITFNYGGLCTSDIGDGKANPSRLLGLYKEIPKVKAYPANNKFRRNARQSLDAPHRRFSVASAARLVAVACLQTPISVAIPTIANNQSGMFPHTALLRSGPPLGISYLLRGGYRNY